ncbi:HSF-type DNA-binding-domain-containing protein [Halteromyces radiatus]|uniref:HSF-type DNA-binding-domain-containing protein n=1 Tax=Halteromyces radiatus TaxID=101107 RepID=UPI0022200C7F|nr:HSF-type DNA-binding-domain-containing protein [Halteromyces radiatus]KAI8097121.1 HSF-type DNA-binding-domain-containing protein [Halteromyces radiatus]
MKNQIIIKSLVLENDHLKEVMVNDRTNQQLISWNPSGTSFLVCNATRFAQEVLPIHFKHSNFSSFVRQLNMYGFHKINKSLRGQRGNNENEVWEFSHVKFQYGRPDLLEGIKRKAMDSELLRRETGDIHASFSMIQMSQSDLLQQFNTLQDQFSNLLTSFEELKKTQLQQQIIIRRLTDATVIHQQSSSSSEKMKVNHSPPPNVLMSQWQQQNHNTNDNDNVLSMCTPESMTLPLSDLQCLPPSPALSDPLSHSQHPSFHTADDTFHRDHLHQSNTLELSFAT